MATLRDAVYGQAVGDALGVPYEFLPRDSFACTDMEGFGSHDKDLGTWSDDTSMALALCDSIRELGRIDCDDIRERFRAWYLDDKYTVDGLFDVGNATAAALEIGHGMTGERDNGNGSLMRTIPLAFTDASDLEIAAVSAITHAHPISTDACIEAVHIARALASGAALIEAVGSRASLKDTPRSKISSGGYVLDTLQAALWCLLTTDDYASCVLTAVNLGRDTDTTASVAGAFAGIVYGYDAIPAGWIADLRGKDIIDACLF